jgi:hypothetical protein
MALRRITASADAARTLRRCLNKPLNEKTTGKKKQQKTTNNK